MYVMWGLFAVFKSQDMYIRCERLVGNARSVTVSMTSELRPPNIFRPMAEANDMT